VRPQRRNAEALLIIEEQIKLGREEVSMIHRGFYEEDLEEVSVECLKRTASSNQGESGHSNRVTVAS
jgi:hypothetical protein